MNIRTYDREADSEEFLKFFNRQTKYAPFSLPMTERYFHDIVLKRGAQEKNYFWVSDEDGKINGAVHFEIDANNPQRGNIFLLMGDSTKICMQLLTHAEEVFSSLGVKEIQCFPWRPNPYEGILYGVEPYCWVGLYSANNAFRHMGYDVTVDGVLMSLSRKNWTKRELPEDTTLEIEEKILVDDELLLQGEFTAYAGSGAEKKHAGRSGYYRLKALSGYLGKGFGQVDIWINDEFQGQNVGRQLMEQMHQRLFSAGVDRIILFTNYGLFRAIKFYEGLGYQAEAVRGFWYAKYL